MPRLSQILLLASVGIFTSVFTINQPSYSYSYTTGTKFSCIRKNGEYFTSLRTEDGKKYQVMKFASIDFPPPYNNIQSRCEEVSSRFQRSYDNGTLKKIVVGRLNRQPVVCAVRYIYESCDRTNLLFTLKKGSQAKAIASRLFNIAAVNDSNIVTANGSDDIIIDFDRYLENLPNEQ